MEKIILYEALVEFEHKSICQEDKSEKSWWSIGLFKNEQDAKYAIQIYEKANKIKGNDCTGNHYVASKVYIKQLAPIYYINLNEFINQNVPVMEYVAFIGTDGLNKLLKEIGVNVEKEKNLRIIERMIRDYQYQIKINENLPVDVEDYKENVKFLQDLRDGKIELK